MKGLQPCSCPGAWLPLIPAPKCRALQSRGLSSVWGASAIRGRAEPRCPGHYRGQDRHRRSFGMSSAAGNARCWARGAALTGPIVGAVLAMMSGTVACRGRPCAPGAAGARFSVGSPWARGFPQCGAFRRPMAVPVNGPRFRGQCGGGAWRAALWSWRGARSLRTKQHSWKLAAVQRLNIHTPFFSPPLKRIWNN